jgi:FkbM family methyltransferase
MKIVKGIAVIDGDECISKWVIESGRLDHDQNMLPLVLDFIPIGGVVIDIGAYIGDHTKAYLDKVGRCGWVTAFEPSKEAFECLRFNTKKYSNIDAINCGVGSKIKNASIKTVGENDGMNYLTDGNDIQVYDLDWMFLNYDGKLDFIKIDCEGYELEVLKGAEKTIKKYKPIMLIEINELALTRNGITRNDIYSWLDSHDYKYRNIYKGQGLNEYQMDIICEPI